MSDTLVALWTEVRHRLEAAGVDSPVLDARLLVEAGAGVSRLDIVTDPRRPVSATQIDAVLTLAKRREAREPVAHIIGRKQFWTLDLAINSDVLIPRPETELVVEAGLELISPDVPSRILDLGVGSGAILLALLAERPQASGVGVDVSAAALAVARGNADALGLGARVELSEGDWDQGISETFDLVVSNPPYIVSSELETLAPEVAHYEPRLALDGGEDGLAAYRRIVGALPRLLKPGGAFALEVGAGQAEPLKALAEAAGLRVDDPLRDLAGIPRVVRGKRAT